MNKSLISLLLMCLTWSAYAEQPADLLQKKLSVMHSMRAHFLQTVRVKRRLVSRSSGVMMMVRPNRFRWETQQPMAQIVVADGKNLWMYDVELEQVTVSKQTRKLGLAGALFLSGDAQAVKHDFTVTTQHSGMTETFDLQAKSNRSSFEHVQLTFKQDSLFQIILDDHLGQHTVLRLSQVVINKPQPAGLFHLHIPPGVDVVYQ